MEAQIHKGGAMHAQPAEIAAVLGLTNPSSVTLLDLTERCEGGLPVECLQNLAEVFGPNEQAILNSASSRSTLRRRQQRGTFRTEESDVLVRLASTWIMARDTFQDDGKAQRFLFSAHPLLGGRRPIDLARVNAVGAEAVVQLLGRLKHGSAA